MYLGDMMFRAKAKRDFDPDSRTYSDRWVYGYYVCLDDSIHRIYSGYAEFDCTEVYPDCEDIDPTTLQILVDFDGKTYNYISVSKCSVVQE